MGCPAWLDFHRQTLLAKCTGLTADRLRQRSALPGPDLLRERIDGATGM